MNREEVKNAIEVMQAWLDGKTVQLRYKNGLGWVDAFAKDVLLWDFFQNDYHIKPIEPRTFWLYAGEVYNVEEMAMKEWKNDSGTKINKPIKVVEVIEE